MVVVERFVIGPTILTWLSSPPAHFWSCRKAIIPITSTPLCDRRTDTKITSSAIWLEMSNADSPRGRTAADARSWVFPWEDLARSTSLCATRKSLRLPEPSAPRSAFQGACSVGSASTNPVHSETCLVPTEARRVATIIHLCWCGALSRARHHTSISPVASKKLCWRPIVNLRRYWTKATLRMNSTSSREDTNGTSGMLFCPESLKLCTVTSSERLVCSLCDACQRFAVRLHHAGSNARGDWLVGIAFVVAESRTDADRVHLRRTFALVLFFPERHDWVQP